MVDQSPAFEGRREGTVKTVSFAANSADLEIIGKLTNKFGVSTSDILRMGLRVFAEKEGIAA